MAKKTKKLLTDHYLRLMDWLSNSPDLNPIEKVARDGSEDYLLFDYNSLSKKKNNKKNEENNIYHEDEIENDESNNESENDLPLNDLEFNKYDEEELPNYENVWN
ncbi:1909_t:CDS:2 [Funneliformis caledonium]|uniref:1909_t:CDS:1 n=1 Tax=Funneliformis caledonium TaxID=1117310 RepID=A0A9N9BL78_9GLOM|nr:1909_t:CDS:2 [Funneliformis caledonium]